MAKRLELTVGFKVRVAKEALRGATQSGRRRPSTRYIRIR